MNLNRQPIDLRSLHINLTAEEILADLIYPAKPKPGAYPQTPRQGARKRRS